MTDRLLNLPKDNGIEAKKERKKFIVDFYSQWIALNPTKQIFNKSLNDFIRRL